MYKQVFEELDNFFSEECVRINNDFSNCMWYPPPVLAITLQKEEPLTRIIYVGCTYRRRSKKTAQGLVDYAVTMARLINAYDNVQLPMCSFHNISKSVCGT
jgi:hypothetical protein